MKKNYVYFVLYIVILVELLIVILERDELEEEEHKIRDKMLVQIAESYKQPIILSIPQIESTYNLGSKEPHKIIMTAIGLTSNEEKEFIKFYVDISKNSKNRPTNWPSGGLEIDKTSDIYQVVREDANGIFLGQFKNTGTFKFEAYCVVNRQLPKYLEGTKLGDELKHMVGDELLSESNKVEFVVDVKTVGGVQKESATFDLGGN